MEDIILALIYDYSIHQRFVDEEFYRTVFNLMIQENMLSQYVKDFKIKSRFSSLFGYYHYGTQELVIYVKMIRICCQKYRLLFNDREVYFYYNLFAAFILFHELEHVNQAKKACELNNYNIENDILRYYMSHEYIGRYLPIKKKENLVKLVESNNIGLIQKVKSSLEMFKTSMLISSKTIEFEVSERFANVIAVQQVLNVIQPIKDEIPNVVEYLESKLLMYKLRGYKYSLEPTILFLKAISKPDEWSDLPWYETDFSERLRNLQNHYSLDDRMKYGVGIDKTEYQSCLEFSQSNPKYSLYRKMW